ncbi:MAG: ectonucleotide pyrophosphatase/phosphodiesterase [Edaphobacter sp.]|uniref:alkaline phosphatase family protein n=1 Tax=Edaphobacter sp. TaxID=1934404 RepID=UPI00238AD269|nr:ectonucleotide pyrophosphatase/phosphodiesterase [Edaphobacter sp.]MDE1178754.1 ectonucleotide pyrophosphatase/phosphodiesterase [Edaphobacter sp.]
MMPSLRHSAFTLASLVLASASSLLAQARPAPLVIISLDGMRPDYVTHADEHGIKAPTLRSFLSDGTYAEGVQGVIPTVTYPSHTTIVTGVWPAEHGIYDNLTFDPLNQHPGEWYWYFNAIKVETLYQAADKAGIKTGAVSWPVTVGAPIDYNIAEYAQSEETDTPNGSPYNPRDILAELGIKVDPKEDHDVLRTRESIAILKKFHPGLMLVHLADLDHQEHEHAPFSPEANAAVEVLDGQVAEIIQAALSIDPATRVAIVSDHGFLRVDHHMHLNALLVENGFITTDASASSKQPSVTAWTAQAWGAGGVAAIVLKDPKDKATLAKMKALLEKAKANPEYGIATVLDAEELHKRGGFPTASFLVDFKEGYSGGGNLSGPLVTDAPATGTHGYLPSRPDLRSTFMIKGVGIAKGRDLRVIDMRQLAPTFAKMLDVTLPAAKLAPVNVKP